MKMSDKVKQALALNALALPVQPRIERIDFAEYTDSLGDPALRVFVILSDKTRETDRSFSKLKPIEAAIRDALDKAEVDLWPYFWFRKASEQSEALVEG